MKVRPLIGRRIRIGRRLHMNQPLQLCKASKILFFFRFSHSFYKARPDEYGFHSQIITNF